MLGAAALLAAIPAAQAADPVAYPATHGSTALIFAGPRLLWTEAGSAEPAETVTFRS